MKFCYTIKSAQPEVCSAPTSPLLILRGQHFCCLISPRCRGHVHVIKLLSSARPPPSSHLAPRRQSGYYRWKVRVINQPPFLNSSLYRLFLHSPPTLLPTFPSLPSRHHLTWKIVALLVKKGKKDRQTERRWEQMRWGGGGMVIRDFQWLTCAVSPCYLSNSHLCRKHFCLCLCECVEMLHESETAGPIPITQQRILKKILRFCWIRSQTMIHSLSVSCSLSLSPCVPLSLCPSLPGSWRPGRRRCKSPWQRRKGCCSCVKQTRTESDMTAWSRWQAVQYSSWEWRKARGREGAGIGKKGACPHLSTGCQSVTEGENDRPQWGPSEPGWKL